MKLFKNIALALVLFSALGITFSILIYKNKLAPISNNNEITIIEIKEGSSIMQIGQTLEEAGLIKDEFFFRIYIKLNKLNNLQAGFYELSEDMGVEKIVEAISSGNAINPEAFNITFPEGKNMRGVAKIIEENTNNTEEDVFNLLKDSSYIDDLIGNYWFLENIIKEKDIYYPLEGYLSPNTYTLNNKSISVKEIFKKMLDQTNVILTKYKDDIESSTYTIHEILTLASVIELEGVNHDDRGKIATVFYNRLEANMPLESDVTTYYAAKVEMNERDLRISELKADNPYNTRNKNMAGKLPIGPIANPGEEAIKATLNPEENDYLYFVADKYKNIYFSKTYKEHLEFSEEIKARGDWITW